MSRKNWSQYLAEACEAERIEMMQGKQKWRDAWRKVKEQLVAEAKAARARQERRGQ